MPESFGARLRVQRERRRIPLSVIADQTKINISLLQALEEDDLSRWPTGIFRRSFVRSYAAAIGLEPEGVVREFLETHPDPAETAATPRDGADVTTTGSNDNAIPPSRFRLFVGSALEALGRQSIEGRPSDGGLDAPTAAVNPPTISQSGGSRADGTNADRARVVNLRDAPARARDGAAATTDAQPVDVAVANDPSAQASPAWNPDMAAAAQLCTDFGRVDDVRELTELLTRAARILGAAGVIVWIRDWQTDRLWPALAHGYAEQVLAQVSPLDSHDNNATAAAFRTGQTVVVKSSHAANGAMVVPLMARVGCVGVLAIELHGPTEQNQLVRALATIFAALLAPLVGDARSSDDYVEARVTANQ